MSEIKLTINGEVVIPSELNLAENINDFSTLQLKINRSHLPKLRGNISNSVELVINQKRAFRGFILNCQFDVVMATLICAPLAYIVNISNMPQVMFSLDLAPELEPKVIIRKCLEYPEKILKKQISKRGLTTIVKYQVFNVGDEKVRVDLFNSYSETPASLIMSLLSNRNVVMTNNANGTLLIGTIPSIYSNQIEHEVTSFTNFSTTHQLESSRSAYGVISPVIISGELGGNDDKVVDDSFLNISLKQVQPSTYPMKQILNNIQTQDLFNFVQVSLETMQDFAVGDIIKNKTFSPLNSSFIVAGKQLNLNKGKISYNYLLRHRDALNVI